MKTEKLSKESVDILLSRLKDEFTAAYLYRSVSNWCKGVGFNKAAEYFAKESASELEHAKKIEDFLTDWNIMPDLPPLAKPQNEFQSLSDVINTAYKLELDLFREYEDDSAKALKMGEITLFNLLQGFVKIQNDSVAEYSDMINLLEGVKEDKFSMLLLQEELFGN